MDVCNNEPRRPVLVSLEKTNAVPAKGKFRTKEITSRYKNGITSLALSTPSNTGRSPSPTASRTPPVPATQRAQSAERRRPSTPSSRALATSSPTSRRSVPSSPSSRSSAPSSPSSRPSAPSSPSSRPSVPTSPSSKPSTPSSPSSRSTTPVRDTMMERLLNSSRRSLGGRAPEGLWPSMRSLSSSFQSESSSLLVSKRDRPARNSSPDHALNSSFSAASERKRTPLRGTNTSNQSENSRPVENSYARVADQLTRPGTMSVKASAANLSKSFDFTDKVSRSASLPIPTRGFSPSRRMSLPDDVNRCLQKSATGRLSLDGSERAEPLMNGPASVTSHPTERANRKQSPILGLHRASSPKKVLPTLSSTSRGMSPSRTSPSSPFTSSSSATSRVGVLSSVLNYISDVRKGKKSACYMEDAHQLRLLYNRDLQWRFVNAHADAAMSTHTLTTEVVLYNVWNITAELCDSIIVKRISVRNLRQEMKLDIILTQQIAHLEDWTALEREHCSSLAGATEALKASTLRLPVTGGATADVHTVKNAISSAVDVMQAMGSSVCYGLSMVEGTNCLISQLSEVAAKERAMLDECRELLASTAAMKVQQCSLRIHLMQLKQDVLRTE